MERRASPVRTCVGCRSRAPASTLLRVVASKVGAEEFGLVPDPDHRMPGRGAHLHPDLACLVRAERRRVFGRALRVTGIPDTTGLREYLDQRQRETRMVGSLSTPDQQGRTTDMSTR